MIETLSDYYRIPESVLGRVLGTDTLGEIGYFRFGSNVICYGQSKSGVATKVEDAGLYDALKNIQMDGADIHLPFDLTRIVENLRRERYVPGLTPGREKLITQEWMLKAYYFVRGSLPDPIRRHMQRVYFSDWKIRPFPAWPVDFTVDNLHEEILRVAMESSNAQKIPFIWYWPEGAPNCLILTHDVETTAGRDFAPQLMDLDDSFGLKASFQVIPESRYEVPDEFVARDPESRV